jgi:putative transposase
MPRRLRCASGGFVYHLLNRAVARATLFDKSADYAASEKVLRQAKLLRPVRLLAYWVMPNHWHFVLGPHADGDLSEFLRWLTVTHTQRWQAHRHTAGTGPLYQGRFKSFPVQEDGHLLAVGRYVERNPLRAGIVHRAEEWRWGSLWHRKHRTEGRLLDPGPVSLPDEGISYVTGPQSEAELEGLRQSARRGAPYGDEGWQAQTAEQLGLGSTLRARGRPRKQPVPQP